MEFILPISEISTCPQSSSKNITVPVKFTKISAKVPGSPPIFCFLIPKILEAETVCNSFAFLSWKCIEVHCTDMVRNIWETACHSHTAALNTFFFFILQRSWISGMNNSVCHLDSYVNSLLKSRDSMCKMQ